MPEFRGFPWVYDSRVPPGVVYFLSDRELFIIGPPDVAESGRIRLMSNLTAKIKVVATAFPTYLVIAAAVVPILSEELAKVLPSGAATVVGSLSLTVVGVLAAAISIIRRVTPVIKSDRGIL